MENFPTIGAMRRIERQSGLPIPALIVLLNTDNPPLPLLELVAEEAMIAADKKLQLRNFLLEGISYQHYTDAPLSLDDLRQIKATNWLDMFKTYVGMMGHNAQEFWQLTLEEYHLALQGFCMAYDIDTAEVGPPASMQELATLMQQFPDQHL